MYPIIFDKSNNMTKNTKKQDGKLVSRYNSEPIRKSSIELSGSEDEEDDDLSNYIGSQDRITLGETFFQNVSRSLYNRIKRIHNSLHKTPVPLAVVKIRQKFQRSILTLKMLLRLLSYQGQHKTMVFLAYISLICTSIAQTKMPQIISQIVDATVVDQDYDKMISYVQYFAAFALFFSVSEFFWGHFFNILAHAVKSDLQLQVYSTLVQREVEFFDKRTIQDILRILHHQVNSTTSICTHKFSSITRNTVQLLYSAWMLASISYKLALFLIATIPVYLVLTIGYDYFRDKLKTQEIQSKKNTDQRVMETMQNIKIVKACSTEDVELDLFGKLLEKNQVHSKKLSFASSTNLAITDFFTNFTLLCIVFIGMNLVSSGEVSFGTLSGFLLYSMAVTMAFRDVSFSYIQVKEAIPDCQNIFHLIDQDSKVLYKGGRTIPNFQGTIEFKNVSFSYPTAPEVQILHHLSLTIHPGDSIAFVGMSGGGKSTIVSILLRFYDVIRGEIKLDNIKIEDIDLQWLHRQIGYVSQEPSLFSGTVEENITYGIENYTEEDLKRAIKMANAEFIFNPNLFPNGLKSKVGERGGWLSGGQKQRIAIARALIRQPKILIFDEATSSLDANSEFEVQKAIDNLIVNSRITTVTIAHRLATVVKCKNIYVIASGKVIEQGSHRELVAQSGAYKSLFERQFQSDH